MVSVSVPSTNGYAIHQWWLMKKEIAVAAALVGAYSGRYCQLEAKPGKLDREHPYTELTGIPFSSVDQQRRGDSLPGGFVVLRRLRELRRRGGFGLRIRAVLRNTAWLLRRCDNGLDAGLQDTRLLVAESRILFQRSRHQKFPEP